MSSPLSIEQRPSPNHGPRAAGVPVDVLLLHYTGMPSADSAVAWLCDPRSQVSSHYFVFEDGRIAQLVPEDRRAWHAGVSHWAGATDLNSASIGIEIANPGHRFGYRAFPPEQVAAVIALSRDILSRWPIPPERVLAHSDIAPSRKEDPGELFPWMDLHRAGIGHLVPAAEARGVSIRRGDSGDAVLALQEQLRRYGYGLAVDGIYGPETQTVVRAFQRHFRPLRVDGIADAQTILTLDRLLASLPVRA